MPATATAGTQGDELKARRMAEQLGLSGERLERLMPLLMSYAQQERLATSELLDQSPSPTDPAFIAALQQRAGISLMDSTLRNQLNEEEMQILDVFDAAQESNILNLLANRQFESWKQSLDFGESEQEVFEVFYHQWQERMQTALNGNLTPSELVTQLSVQENRIIAKLTTILPDDQIKKIRIIQEAANDPAIRKLYGSE
jgi:maltodextrin utilization protein YvdJ